MSEENDSRLEYLLVEAAHRRVAEGLTCPPLDAREPATVPLADLPRSNLGEPYFHEWNTYLREAVRLIDEGHEGKFVLIKEEAIVGIFDTRESALTEGAKRFLLVPFLVQHIRSREPILQVRGYNMPWPCSASPLAKPA